MKLFYSIFVLLIFFLNNQKIYGSELSCKDPSEKKVDWWFAYNIPDKSTINYGNDFSQTDSIHRPAYVYRTNLQNNQLHWNIIHMNLFDENSLIFKTLRDVQNNPSNYYYVMYNKFSLGLDGVHLSISIENGDFGDSKGVLVWEVEKETAIWLVHSANDFPKPFTSNKNPTNEMPFHIKRAGQVFMCLQIKYKDLKNIFKHLIIMKIKVYDHRLPVDSLTGFLTQKLGIYEIPQKKKSGTLTTQNENSYSIINRKPITSSQSKEAKNIWIKVVRFFLYLKEDLYIKSYPYFSLVKINSAYSKYSKIYISRISEYPRTPIKEIPYHFYEITSLNFTVLDHKHQYTIEFKAEKDASTYGIAKNSGIFCISDSVLRTDIKERAENAVCINDHVLTNAMYRFSIIRADNYN